MTDAPAIPADVAAMIGGPQVINAAEAAGISPPPMPAMFGGRARLMQAAAEPVASVAPAMPEPAAPVAVVPSLPLVEAAPLPAPAVEAAPQVVPTAPAAPGVVFLGSRSRSQPIPLEWPVSLEGVEYHSIVITRPSAREVGEFFERLAAALREDPTALVRFPIYRDAAGQVVPEAVMDALDDDDLQVILEAVSDFLPRRLRPVPDRLPNDDTSARSRGDGSEPISAE